MKTLFIRHGKLLPPYDNYNNLSLSQLDDLAKGTVNPGIDSSFAKEKVGILLNKSFFVKNEFDLLYVSPAKRAKETAQVLAQSLEIESVKEITSLKEIIFSPRLLISESSFSTDGLGVLRDAVFTAIQNDQLEEKQDSFFERLQEIERIISENQEKNIVFVTHGFFLRLVQIYFQMKKDTFLLEDLKKATNFSYMEGFYLKNHL